jgi:hypothetical protein
MPFKFNPFTGTFDLAGSKVDTYLDGEVATYDDLPLDPAAAPLNSAWLVREASGLWFLTRKPAGIYVRSAAGGTDRDADYTYAGTFPDVFSDANFVVYNDADSTKNVKFSAANLTTGTTRTLTIPDASGTLPLLESANTFTQNQTLDGTNNVAPSQTAASGSSLITRDLGDERFLRQFTEWNYAHYTTFATSNYVTAGTQNGGATSVEADAHTVRVSVTDAADSRAVISFRRAYWATFNNTKSNAQATLDWSRRGRLAFGLFANPTGLATPRTATFHISWGKNISSAQYGDLNERGVGWKISEQTITPQVHDGTSLTQLTAITNVLTANANRDVILMGIQWEAGSVQFYINGALVGTTTAGPTGSHNANTPAIVFEASARTAGNPVPIEIGNIQFSMAP